MENRMGADGSFQRSHKVARTRRRTVEILEELVKIRAADTDLKLCDALGKEKEQWAIDFTRAYWIAGRVRRPGSSERTYESLSAQDVTALLAVREDECRNQCAAWLLKRPHLLAIVREALTPPDKQNAA